MISKKQYKYHNLYKLPVVVMYVLFFTVQLFFNFDIANNNNYGNFFPSSVSSTKCQASVKADVQQNSKTNIRLNKRFQPANVPACEPFTVEVVVQYLQQQNSHHYQNPSLPLSALTTRQLRGPPVVA